MSENDQKESMLPHQPDLALLESFRYINGMPGKNVRGKLIDCFQLWMNVESEGVLDSIKVEVTLFLSSMGNVLFLLKHSFHF